MIFFSQLIICLLYLLLVSIFRNPQHFVIVSAVKVVTGGEVSQGAAGRLQPQAAKRSVEFRAAGVVTGTQGEVERADSARNTHFQCFCFV